MEGIGYWIFLLAMYLISTLAKKRKQKQAWEALDEEDQNKEIQPKPDFIEKLFGDLVSEDDSFLSEIKDTGEEELIEDEIPIETVPEFTEIPDDKITQPFFETYESLVSKRHVGTISHWGQPKKITTMKPFESILVQLKGESNLRKSIILKEILDKPKALRR